jgi:hypothetical protein
MKILKNQLNYKDEEMAFIILNQKATSCRSRIPN